MLKRILALAGIGILAALYIVTLILALMNNDLTHRFFMASIICTVIIPVLIYIFQWIYKMVKKDAQDAREKVYATAPSADAGKISDESDSADTETKPEGDQASQDK